MLNRIDDQISDASRRVTMLLEISRWIWITNLIVMIAAIVLAHYGVAVLSGLTWLTALSGAGIGRGTLRCLASAERAEKLSDLKNEHKTARLAKSA